MGMAMCKESFFRIVQNNFLGIIKIKIIMMCLGMLMACSISQALALDSASAVVHPANPSGQVDVSWSDSYGAYCTDSYYCDYTIQRKTGINGTWVTLAEFNIDGTYGSYSDTTVSPGTIYYYRVWLNDYCGCLNGTGYIDTAAVTTAGAPPAPTALSGMTASSTQINLSWTDNSASETSFKIERKTGSGGTYAQVAAVGANVTSYSDTGLNPGTTYYYHVRASNSSGDSTYSNEVNATTSAVSVPGAPSGLGASAVSSAQINLTWTDNSSNEIGFKIERKTGSAGTYGQIATAPANTISYSDTGLTGGTTYYYRIRASNASGDSAYASEVNATTSSGGNSSAVGKRTSAFEYDSITGLLTKEIIEPDNSNLCLVTTYTYDNFANRTAVTVRNCNGNSGEAPAPAGDAIFAARTTTNGYDSAGRFATSVTNALSQTETHVYDNNFGVVTSLTGPNNLTTTWTYDTFGRKTLETRADGNKTQTSYLFCNGVNGGTIVCPTNGKYLVQVTPQNSSGTANGPVSRVYFDMLGREIRSETEGFDGTKIYKDTQYDSLGRVLQVSEPYYAGATPVWTTFQYDTLGRPIQQTAPNGGLTAMTYNGLTTTVTNPLNQTETQVKNSQGQLVSVTKQ